MSRFIDLTNCVFGRWTVIRYAGQKSNTSRWLCRCACGTEAEVMGTHLKTGATQSCGCYRAEVSTTTNLQHGYTRHPLYRLWLQMIDRCENPNNAWFHRYGKRGVYVCERWHHFPNFCEDMEPRPEGMTLDRVDPDGPYSAENCRWATPKQQAETITHRHRYLTANGETLSIAEWAGRLGVSPSVIHQRLHRGCTNEEALTSGTMERRKRK